MIRLASLTLLLLTSPLAHAQFFTGPVASATGHAGRAAVDPNEAGILNPAAVAQLRSYNVGLNYGLGHHEAEGDFHQYGILLADGTPDNLFPGAISYERRTLTPMRAADSYGPTDVQSDLVVTIANMLFQRFSVGLSAHRQTDDIDSGGTFAQYSGHLGILWTPFDTFGIGLVGYDLVPTSSSDSVPAGAHIVPTYAIGTNWVIQEILHLRLDLERPDRSNPDHRMNVMAGLETFFRTDFAFRFGSLWKETTDQNFLTGGFGYRGPKLSIDYTYEKDIRVADSGRHLVDLWIPF